MAEYTQRMNPNPIIHCTFIIRGQIEYSLATQTVSLRCLLEMPITGQRRGFTDMKVLLAALQAELMALQKQIIPLDQEKGET
ncbi:hypothetical protein BH10CHL1_BH10CHL1_26970 [soil metagenome]